MTETGCNKVNSLQSVVFWCYCRKIMNCKDITLQGKHKISRAWGDMLAPRWSSTGWRWTVSFTLWTVYPWGQQR
jgi:hypothetical protein